MDMWVGLRTAVLIVVWVTVGGGVLMATIWIASGGGRAYGPDDELMARSGIAVERTSRRVTSLSTAQVGIHGLVGLLTAGLVTYGVLLDDDRTDGYIAMLVALAGTAIPGLFMFRKWRSGRRPSLPAAGRRDAPERVEDHLPGPVVYLHGLAAVATAALVVVLILVD